MWMKNNYDGTVLLRSYLKKSICKSVCLFVFGREMCVRLNVLLNQIYKHDLLGGHTLLE